MTVNLSKTFEALQLNPIQSRILKEAGVNGAGDPKFRQILRASVDFAYHAELYFPDPSDPNKPLRLERWQKEEITYCQIGEGYNERGMAIRKPIAINSPRGFGKSVFSSVTGDEFALHFPFTKVALFSTSQEQANDLMDKVRYNVKHSIFSFMINKKMDSKTQIGLINGSIIKAFPQSEVTIRGFHPHIKIIDEKARIKREILESAIRPMGRKVCWLEIGISTPFGRNNNHYEDCMNTDVYHVRLLKPTDVSWVDDKKLSLEVKMMGDRIARQELYAEFLEDADSVFKPSLIELMLSIDLKPQFNGSSTKSYILGVDFGKHRDYTAICVLHTENNGMANIDLLERHYKTEYKMVIERIRQISQSFNIKLIVPDGTGVGIAVLEDLVARVKVPIYMTKIKKKDEKGKDVYRMGFIFTNASKINIVDETCRYMMNSKLKCPHHYNTTDPRNPNYIFKVLENEMLDYTYTTTALGSVVYSHPEDGKSHDDTLTALLLAVWGIRFVKFDTPVFGGAQRIGMPYKLDLSNRKNNIYYPK